MLHTILCGSEQDRCSKWQSNASQSHLGFLFVGPYLLLLGYKRWEGRRKKEEKEMFDFWIKTSLYLFWMKIFSVPR